MSKPYQLNDVRDEYEVVIGEHSKIVIRKLFYMEDEYLDFRKWGLWGDKTEWKPMKQGILVKLNTFRTRILPAILKVVNVDKST